MTLPRALAALLASLWVVLATVAPSYADDRSTTMPADLKATGVYLEPAAAMGDADLWRTRLKAGVRKADLPVPVSVALWSEIPGAWPDPEDVVVKNDAELLELFDLPPRSVALLTEDGSLRSVSHLPGRAAESVRAWENRADAVVSRIEAAGSDADRDLSLSAVAEAWVYLRVADADGASPQELVAELSGDTSLFDDTARAPEPPSEDFEDEFNSPWVLVSAACVLVGAVGLFVWKTWQMPRGSLSSRVAAGPRRTPDDLIATLTPLALEEQVTRLAEAISSSDVRPGNPAYDEAQACLDAAAKYVDSARDRDRVGVHLLVEDGHAALAGARSSRCFFHPLHPATTSVKRRSVSLPCCKPCARGVTDGKAPQSLMVTGDDGTVRAYYESEDVWTTTGYGALDERWAKRALLASLEAR
ncbi:hypothetical protein [Nocardioides sp. Root151]|uniref:hypothetical protein n=1 Tax=Nocardioides sp. Root151 TaxID=1736475 RepID=UPI0012E36331|nr:hypothetical protein [Nocardioides sp. Root151]